MRTLVIGGGASGKSEYAEELFATLEGTKYYIATMMPYGEDSLARIEKHRKARRDRGFHTVERYTDLAELALPSRGAVLLECLGNLTANELFYKGASEESAAEAILRGIERLSAQADNLVVVTNEVFSDGIRYDEGTLSYMRTLAFLNRRLAKSFDTVIEVMCGIPVTLKG